MYLLSVPGMHQTRFCLDAHVCSGLLAAYAVSPPRPIAWLSHLSRLILTSSGEKVWLF